MIIRRLLESDYDQFYDLYRKLDDIHVRARPDCFVRREEVFPLDHYIHNLAYPGGLLLGAFDEQVMIGFVEATLWEKSGMVKGVKTVYLDNIYVLPEYRRNGIARKFFAEVEFWAMEHGAVRLDLQTWGFNQSAIALYESMGMRPQRLVYEKKL